MAPAAALAATLAFSAPARAQMQVRDVRMCSTQTEDLAEERIAACTAMLSYGGLRGKPEGLTYALRGLAYLDRGDIAHAISDLDQAIALAPDFAPAYQNRGNAWYARGNYGQAIADYDETIKLDPNSASPYVNRATVRRDLGYTEGALEDYEKAMSLSPNRASSYNGRGQIYLRQKDYARAIADFDYALRLAPSTDNYMLRAQAREGADDLDRALHDYQEAAKLDPKKVSAFTAQGAIWRKKGNLDKALVAYDHAVLADQNQPTPYSLRAEVYAAKGDRKRAMSDISRALKFTWDIRFLKVRGELRLDDGDIDGVLHDADAMLKLDAENASALALRGAGFARRKDYNRAFTEFDKAIKADSNNALAYGERGQLYLAKNDVDRALSDLNRAIELGTISPAPYRARATIFKNKGDTARAIADLNQAIQRDPRPAEPYLERAALHKAKGDTALVLADLSEGLAHEPGNVAALMARAQIRQDKGEVAGAIADYDAVLKRDPKNATALNIQAKLLMQTKSYAKAVDDLDRLIRLQPKNAQAYYQRGLAHGQAEQLDKAIADYTLALVHDSNMSHARQALTRAVVIDRRRKEEIAAERERQLRLASKPAETPAAMPEDAEKPPQDAKPQETAKQAALQKTPEQLVPMPLETKKQGAETPVVLPPVRPLERTAVRDRNLTAHHNNKFGKPTQAAGRHGPKRGTIRSAEQHRRDIYETTTRPPRKFRVGEKPRRKKQKSVGPRDSHFTEIWIERR